jgi:hypothetical protein
MDHESAIEMLEEYEKEIDGIISRFRKTRSGIHIADLDGQRFEQITIELRDFYSDVFGRNTYSGMTVEAFNEGVSNFLGSPSLHSVQRVKGIVSSVIARIKRNPKIINQPEPEEIDHREPLTLPEKVTLHWLFHNVPYRFWVWLTSLLIASFLSGVAVTAKISWIQELVGMKS